MYEKKYLEDSQPIKVQSHQDEVIEKFTELLICSFNPTECKEIINEVRLNLINARKTKIEEVESKLKQLHSNFEILSK